MRGLTKAVGGSGLLISGTMMWLFIFSGLDLDRVRNYGLFHELSLRSNIPVFIFLFACLLIFAGVMFILSGIVEGIMESRGYNFR